MQWVLRAQCGDRDALEALLRGVQPSLRRYLSGVAGATDADDLLQDVLVLIFRIASREAFRHVKKRRTWQDRHESDSALETLPAPEVRPPDEALRDLLA